MKTVLRRVAGRTSKSPALLRLFSAVVRVADRFSPRRISDGTAQPHAVLLAPPGGGNIGDQALVEAFIENTAGDIVVVARDRSDYPSAQAFGERVRVAIFPSLLYGRVPNSLGEYLRFRSLLWGARSFAVCGADIMDGAYNSSASAKRSILAEDAARRGIDSRVLGFSWNGRASSIARKALRRAADAGVKLFLRDPISAARAREDALENVIESADVVFCARSTAPERALEVLKTVEYRGGKLALLNVSGLIDNETGLAEDYRNICAYLQERGHEVVLLPHVIRGGADDLHASRKFLEEWGSAKPAPLLIEEQLVPAEVRSLCALANIVVTGRMHLAIMALMAGKAPVTLATQGKVEGLMELFSTPYLCVAPRPGMSVEVLEALRRIELGDMNGRVDSLERVRVLSARNFQ